MESTVQEVDLDLCAAKELLTRTILVSGLETIDINFDCVIAFYCVVILSEHKKKKRIVKLHNVEG